MTMRTGGLALAAVLLLAGAAPAAQAPDGNAVLRAAGVDVPRSGAEAAFNAWLVGPAPVPPAAFPTLIVGMGPVGPRARVRNAYAFGVLASRSARRVPPGELAGAGVALLQMIVADERPVRIAGARVAGRVFASPLDGQPPGLRPVGLVEALILMINGPHAGEQAAAMEALGLLGEIGAAPTVLELYRASRERPNPDITASALEALARLAPPGALAVAEALARESSAERQDAAGLAAAFLRERLLGDGSRRRLESALGHRTLGPTAGAYLAELAYYRP